jgi:diguanylate cyclase (GGDEF)-like protein
MRLGPFLILAERRSRNVRMILLIALSVLLFFVLELLVSLVVPGHPTLAQFLAALLAAPVTVALTMRLSTRSSPRADRFRDAAENTVDDFYLFEGVPDDTGQIVDFLFAYINPAAERRLRTPRDQFLGRLLSEVRPYATSSGVLERYKEVVRTGIPYIDEIFIDDGTIHATWIHLQAVKIGNSIAVTSRDFTELKRVSDRVHFLAHYDQLTGLPNRTLLRERLSSAMLRGRRHNHKVAVFLLDIDHFKRINDSLGHAVGDALLLEIGKRLLNSGRETDTVARLGGDEFVIVLPEVKSMEDVNRCGLKLLEAVAAPITLQDHQMVVTASIGVCIYPDGGLEMDELLKRADAAMYTVKAAGRNGLNSYPIGGGNKIGN